jgi:fumarate reductase flavoprotein subunit
MGEYNNKEGKMKRLEADVVVMGAGTAGLPAAVTVAEGGGRVILFEKRGATGGHANMANAILGVESRLQKLNPPVLTKEKAFRDHMEWVHWRADSLLVKAFYDKSGDTIDWLEKMGVEFDVWPYPVDDPEDYNTPHWVKAPSIDSAKNVKRIEGTATLVMRILTSKARELGVQIYPKTPVTKILKRGGRITGVIAKDSSGEEIRVNAKAVIIASGGFGDNPEWIKKYLGLEEGVDLFSVKVLGVKGDGIRMAWEVGAAQAEMSQHQLHHLPPPCQGPGGTAPELRAFNQPTNIMVNLLGLRFIPEEVRGGHQVVSNAIFMQKKRTAFTIFDGDTKKYYDELGLNSPQDSFQRRPGVFKYDNLDDNIKALQERGYKYLFAAQTLEELCTQTGIDLDGLQQTVAEYNRFCEIGHDESLNKNPKYLRPIRKPKFYAARFFIGSFSGQGGIKINHKTEVLDKDWEVIPGLYATGNDANLLYGGTGGTYVLLAGNNMGFAMTSGRIAAENALEYIKTIGK